MNATQNTEQHDRQNRKPRDPATEGRRANVL
jgi:hypothetical protein